MNPKNKPFLIISIFFAIIGVVLLAAGSFGGGAVSLVIGVLGILMHVSTNRKH